MAVDLTLKYVHILLEHLADRYFKYGKNIMKSVIKTNFCYGEILDTLLPHVTEWVVEKSLMGVNLTMLVLIVGSWIVSNRIISNGGGGAFGGCFLFTYISVVGLFLDKHDQLFICIIPFYTRRINPRHNSLMHLILLMLLCLKLPLVSVIWNSCTKITWNC